MLQLQLHYTTLHPAVVLRWPLQPLQPLQKTQFQPPFGLSVDSLCHPWFTTTNLSYRFPTGTHITIVGLSIMPNCGMSCKSSAKSYMKGFAFLHSFRIVGGCWTSPSDAEGLNMWAVSQLLLSEHISMLSYSQIILRFMSNPLMIFLDNRNHSNPPFDWRFNFTEDSWASFSPLLFPFAWPRASHRARTMTKWRTRMKRARDENQRQWTEDVIGRRKSGSSFENN